MKTKSCKKCSPLGKRCDCPTESEAPQGPSDEMACSAVATIRRHKYPHEYSGWNVEHDSPKWTSDRLGAAPVPLEILVSELNKIAAGETNIWAVVYPQNADVEPPSERKANDQ